MFADFRDSRPVMRVFGSDEGEAAAGRACDRRRRVTTRRGCRYSRFDIVPLSARYRGRRSARDGDGRTGERGWCVVGKAQGRFKRSKVPT